MSTFPGHADENTRHYDATYTLGEDGSVSVEEIQTRPDTDGCPSQQELDQQAEQLGNAIESIEPLAEDGRCGYKATWKDIPESDLTPSNAAFPNLFTEASRDGSRMDLTINNKLLDDTTGASVSWTFVFPGKVQQADGAQIDGNRALWSDIKSAPRQIHITGELKAAGQPAENGRPAENDSGADTAQSAEKDFPWLAVILGAAGGLVVVLAAIVVVVLVRRKRRRAVPPQPGLWGPGQQYPPYPGQQHPGLQSSVQQNPAQQNPGQQNQTPQNPGQQHPGQQNQTPPWQAPPPQP